MSSGVDGGDIWLIGMILTGGAFILTLVGGVVARDRQMSRQIREGDEKLHERINRVREDMVHKSDQDMHLKRLDANINDMREEQRELRRETTSRLDQLIKQMSSGGST